MDSKSSKRCELEGLSGTAHTPIPAFEAGQETNPDIDGAITGMFSLLGLKSGEGSSAAL
ncbi:MAG TPA: hypothetical protein VF784_01445 [Anaerolineales bacterium]